MHNIASGLIVFGVLQFCSIDHRWLLFQVPHYSLTTLDDGSFEKLRLIVELPGTPSIPSLMSLWNYLLTRCFIFTEVCKAIPTCAASNLLCHTGVESSAGLHVEIEGSRAFVHLPGKYRLVRMASSSPAFSLIWDKFAGTEHLIQPCTARRIFRWESLSQTLP